MAVIRRQTIRPHHGPCVKTRNCLVNIMSVLTCAILTLSLTAHLSQCIVPPRLYIPHTQDGNHGAPSAYLDRLATDVEEPYILSINDGHSKAVPFKARSNITTNLNRAIPEDIDVLVTVYSGPDLIAFDDAPPSISKQYDGHLPSSNEGTNLTIKYASNTFGDRVVSFHTNNLAGHVEIVCKVVKRPNSSITVDDSTAYISVDIYRDWNLNVLIQIVGWIYFSAWSISFYFQVLLNYQRKSVVGLNFDFLALNLLGFTCYSIYNLSLLFSYRVQQDYYKRYTYSRIPVEYNDLFFSLHAFALTLVTAIQCFIYDRGEQHISLPAGIFTSLASVLGLGMFVTSLFDRLSILDVVLYLSYVKLVITTIKYVPQAYMNYQRKATTGWSIHNIILDFTGGSFSFLQMLLIAYNYNDWISIFGNFAKFGLGLISMIFDLVFFVQHYILYRDSQPLVNEDLENSSDSVPSPIISESIRSANTAQKQQQAEDSDETND